MTQVPSSSSVEIVSVHVPKTGGTAFNSVLKQVYRSDEILFNYSNYPLDFLIEQQLITPDIRAICGHFDALTYKKSYPLANLIIWLRHPVLLLISSYFFWQGCTRCYFDERHKDVIEKKLSLLEYAELPYVRNSLSTYFCSGVDLQDFYFVGIHEFFVEDLQDFRKMLGWESRAVDIVNKNPYPDYQNQVKILLNDKTTFDRISELNKEDIGLYRDALNLRAKRRENGDSIEMFQAKLHHSQIWLHQVQSKLSSTSV